MSDTWPADHVERRAVSGLVPYARNARTHSEAQVAQIAASIREWGWTVPVLIDEAGTLIAGHGRVLAAQKLGLAEIPVMIARGWTEAQRRSYVLADNKLALNAGWDTDMLRVEISDLQALGVDLGLAGFASDELEALRFDDDLLDTSGIGDGSAFNKANLRFGDKVVPLSDQELEELTAAFDAHYADCGVAFGFVRRLLSSSADE